MPNCTPSDHIFTIEYSICNQVLKAMKESDSPRPAVFAMSNPTTKAECTPDDVFKHVGENAIFASGSPFSNVSLGNSCLLSFALFYINNSQ